MPRRRHLLLAPLALAARPGWGDTLPAGTALAEHLLLPASPAHLQPAFTGQLEARGPTRLVPAGSAAPAWPAQPLNPTFRYLHEGVERTVEDYFTRRPVTGLLVLHRGSVLVERYAPGLGPSTRFLSASMAKSFVGLLAGIAAGEGLLPSLDDAAQHHAPALAGTPWGQVAIRHLLEMSSGVRFNERYEQGDDIVRLVAATAGGESAGGADVLRGPRERRAAAGRLFAYSSADTQALALVLSGALAPLTLSGFMSTRLWQPMGAEAPASFLLDRSGQEAAFAFLHASLRDYARLGQLLADGGRVGSRQVVPETWLAASTRATPHAQPHVASDFFGHGRQFWVFPGERRQFAMLGVRGQCVWVDPAAGLVLAHTALWPTVGDRAARAELLSLWKALVALHA